MARLRVRAGDATEPVSPGSKIICHVCNDAGVWGRGFVMAISARWAAPETRYREWHQGGGPVGFQLGAVQVVQVESDIWVANMIAQHGTRPKDGKIPLRYDALETCLREVAVHARELGATVHMPRIGAGLAGGDWGKIRRLVVNVLDDFGVTGFVYVPR